MNYTVWIMLYGLLYWLAERASAITGRHHVLTALFMLLYWFAFFSSFNKSSCSETHYICFSHNKKMFEYLVYTPMLLMSVTNAIISMQGYGAINTDVQIQNVNMISVLDFGIMCLITINCVIGEEVVFRSALPLWIIKHFKIKALPSAIMSSLFFAGMHILNIFSGQRMDYTLLQMLNAGAVGFCLAIISRIEQSIVPGIVIHSIINISSLWLDKWNADIVGRNFRPLIIQPMLYAVYGGYLYRKEKRGKGYETVY